MGSPSKRLRVHVGECLRARAWQHACACVCVCECLYGCAYVLACLCLCVCAGVCLCFLVSGCLCMCVFVRLCLSVCVCSYVCVMFVLCLCACVCVRCLHNVALRLCVCVCAPLVPVSFFVLASLHGHGWHLPFVYRLFARSCHGSSRLLSTHVRPCTMQSSSHVVHLPLNCFEVEIAWPGAESS